MSRNRLFVRVFATCVVACVLGCGSSHGGGSSGSASGAAAATPTSPSPASSPSPQALATPAPEPVPGTGGESPSPSPTPTPSPSPSPRPSASPSPSPSPSPASGPPALGTSPASGDFADTPLDSTTEVSFTVTNTGGGTLAGVAVLGSQSTAFAFQGASAYTLASGQSATIVVRFTPSDLSRQTSVIFFDAETGETSATLAGSGTPAPAMPRRFDFVSSDQVTTASFQLSGNFYFETGGSTGQFQILGRYQDATHQGTFVRDIANGPAAFVFIPDEGTSTTLEWSFQPGGTGNVYGTMSNVE